MTPRSKWCLIGIPDHEAVLNLGGRAGAARGPEAFRKEWLRLTDCANTRARCVDFGNAQPLGRSILENHRSAAALITKAHQTHPISIVIGGSHDHGASHLAGILAANPRKKLGCINIDAHLDLRAPIQPGNRVTSGSPFYLAIEDKILDPKRFVEFGIQSHCNGPALWEYAKKKKIRVIPFEDLRLKNTAAKFNAALKTLAKKSDSIVISLDLDSISENHAPGVSAPQSEGFSSSEIIEMISIAARHPKVVSLGIFELNPEHDIDLRTARLAAKIAFTFAELV